MSRPVSVAHEFALGIGTLFRGFGTWRRRPALMILGLVPALIVAAALTALVVLFLVNAETITAFLTPFADPWPEFGRSLLRVLLAVALLVGILAGSVLGFTALTLVVGDPFYERIWRAVERDLGAPERLEDPPFWRTVGDSVVLVVRAALVGLLSFAIGLIPVVGAALAVVLGVWFGGRNLATELTARPLEARGFDRRARAALLRTRRARVTGFGIATHLLFLVPGGAVVGMAPAVAGATALARELLGSTASAGELSGPVPPAEPRSSGR